MNDAKKAFERGDIVQITDESDPWYGCLLVVSRAHSGEKAMGFHSNPSEGFAYRFLRQDNCEIVGRTALELRESDDDDERNASINASRLGEAGHED